jgi:NAD(P)-dependent dehydrogenase (short-subunit alcohol dehydrogenase family)
MGTMVVTGASTGVGRAVAELCAGRGYDVYALARSRAKLEALAAASSGKIRACPCDITDTAAVAETFEAILAEAGGVDVLVNNAGLTGGPKPVDFDLIDAVIDTNLKGTMYCTYAVLPAMRKRGAGHIINVASISGVVISPEGNNGLYAASKYGQVAFGDSIGKMVRRDGILVTNLCPGGIDTPLWNDENPYPFDKGEMIKPEEVADLIDYVLKQPKRTLFKNVVFVPVVEQW